MRGRRGREGVGRLEARPVDFYQRGRWVGGDGGRVRNGLFEGLWCSVVLIDSLRGVGGRMLRAYVV